MKTKMFLVSITVIAAILIALVLHSLIYNPYAMKAFLIEQRSTFGEKPLFWNGESFAREMQNHITAAGYGDNANFIATLSNSGKVLSSYCIPDFGAEVTDVFVSDNGEVAVAGEALPPPALSPAFFAVIDNGIVKLSENIVGIDGVRIEAIEKCKDSYIVGGWVSKGGSIAFPPSDSRCFLAKILSNGNIQWSEMFGENGSRLVSIKKSGDAFYAIGVTKISGNLLFIKFNGDGKILFSESSAQNQGDFTRSLNDRNLAVNGDKCVVIGQKTEGFYHKTIIIRLDESGNVVGSTEVSYKNGDVFPVSACFAGDNLILLGNIDDNPSAPSDVLVAGIENNGNLEFARGFSCTGSAFASSLSVKGNGDILISGKLSLPAKDSTKGLFFIINADSAAHISDSSRYKKEVSGQINIEKANFKMQKYALHAETLSLSIQKFSLVNASKCHIKPYRLP